MPCCRVAVVERGPLKGREQEWNISRKEIAELVSDCPRKGALAHYVGMKDTQGTALSSRLTVL